jgi:hypothetical protein
LHSTNVGKATKNRADEFVAFSFYEPILPAFIFAQWQGPVYIPLFANEFRRMI